jgi:photosystem II stability/assembly factor-like uncharacterized protein
MQALKSFWKKTVLFLAVLSFCLSFISAIPLSARAGWFLPSLEVNPWQTVDLSTEANLLDVAFAENPGHGWLVGSNSTILETTDAGKTWAPVKLNLGDQNYRLNSVSFAGQDGWITGEPALLLHTTDAGKSWYRVPLSAKLPGAPNMITALGQDAAEMSTDVGAIYRTTDGGKTWKALVQSAFGVTRSIVRSPNGRYIAVSSNGSFYSIWEPGLQSWEPHNRNSSRRVQNMGFVPDGRLWMLARGGEVQFTTSDNVDEWEDVQYPEAATSWGFLDLAYQSSDDVWLSGGSGNLLYSSDGGKTWKKDRALENVPSNLYKIRFVSPEQGFIMGQRGTLLRYDPTATQAT